MLTPLLLVAGRTSATRATKTPGSADSQYARKEELVLLRRQPRQPQLQACVTSVRLRTPRTPCSPLLRDRSPTLLGARHKSGRARHPQGMMQLGTGRPEMTLGVVEAVVAVTTTKKKRTSGEGRHTLRLPRSGAGARRGVEGMHPEAAGRPSLRALRWSSLACGLLLPRPGRARSRNRSPRCRPCLFCVRPLRRHSRTSRRASRSSMLALLAVPACSTTKPTARTPPPQKRLGLPAAACLALNEAVTVLHFTACLRRRRLRTSQALPLRSPLRRPITSARPPCETFCRLTRLSHHGCRRSWPRSAR